ncbi:MAG: aminopeptidase P N-terminal domain-containing protein [Lachnospiraceae bacterium]|nr:aminopeptidase P N-terminal domain-containing protein [Lachnospiraceae bacterium]
MKENSVAIIYSGVAMHVSEDEYMAFQVNKNFRYLTDIAREQMILVLDNTGEKPSTRLYIEEADPLQEKWLGKKLTKDEAKEISGIEDVQYLDAFSGKISFMISRSMFDTAYFDLFHGDASNLPSYNEVKAKEFHETYMGIGIRDLYPILSHLRMKKDEEEVKRIRKAVEITKEGLQQVMKRLKPGMMEYQAQAIYEGVIHYQGSEGPSFATIAGSGFNGTMMHYGTNHCECKDGTLLLLDLGTKYQGWCSDITRTYPVNGKYTKRQKEIYDIVLAANKKVIECAKPGITTKELNDIAKEVLAKGLKDLGLIKEDSELSKYYMHGVGHHLGLDVHDCTNHLGDKLTEGAVITDEPGIYIEEESIGIRIEDDLLITKDGCEVLSKDIIKTTEEIEKFMAEN